MVRPKHIDPPVSQQVNIPKSIFDKMKTELYSDVEGRVPYGAISTLVSELITKWLEARGVQI